jgi:hypothetical protein
LARRIHRTWSVLRRRAIEAALPKLSQALDRLVPALR